jgi:hypothetical protein
MIFQPPRQLSRFQLHLFQIRKEADNPLRGLIQITRDELSRQLFYIPRLRCLFGCFSENNETKKKKKEESGP